MPSEDEAHGWLKAVLDNLGVEAGKDGLKIDYGPIENTVGTRNDPKTQAWQVTIWVPYEE